MKQNRALMKGVAAAALLAALTLASCGSAPEQHQAAAPKAEAAQTAPPAPNAAPKTVLETGKALEEKKAARRRVIDAANAKGVTAADFEYDMNRSGTGIIIKKYKGDATIVVIPATIEGFPVREFDPYAIRGNKELESITIPASFTGDLDFSDCNSLRQVNLPSGYAKCPRFVWCSSLTSFTVPSGVKAIPDEAFYGSGLQSITIPAGVTSIGQEAFTDCHDLQSVTLPPGLTRIGEGAFIGCSSLETINLPESLTTIGLGAFRHCRKLSSIVIPRNVSLAGHLWEEGIDGQYYYYFRIDSITGPFQDCTGLQSVTFQGNVKVIGINAFKGCTALKSVTLNGSVEYLGEYAFADCTALTDLTINGNIGRMGCYIALSGTAAGPGETWYEYMAGLDNGDRDSYGQPLHKPDPSRSFERCTSLTTVTVGPNVRKIHDVDTLINTGKLTLASKAALAKVR
jgi:hypothetical protein